MKVVITIEAPDGTTVKVDSQEGEIPEDAPVNGDAPVNEDAVARYWKELSDNGRLVYSSAANLVEPFSLEEIAAEAGVDYESLKSMHRSSMRTARWWRDNFNTEAPIQLEHVSTGYDDHPHRSLYRLPVAEQVRALATG